MRKKIIGQLLRGMNSLEYVTNQYVHYHSLNIDFFNMINTIQSLTLDDINTFMKDWIKEDQLAVCKIVTET